MSPEAVSDDIETFLDTVSERIETMKGWSFQYNPGTDDYSLFFGLLDETGESVSANVDADIRIVNDNGSEIKEGTSSSGTVYFTVYKGNVVLFDEVNCIALYCLPVSDIELAVDNLPVELKVKGYDGSTESIIKITEVSYTFEKEYTPQLKITLIGQKTFGNNSNYDIISYKLYDSEEYLIDTSIIIYDVTPEETYSLRLTEYSR